MKNVSRNSENRQCLKQNETRNFLKRILKRNSINALCLHSAVPFNFSWKHSTLFCGRYIRICNVVPKFPGSAPLQFYIKLRTMIQLPYKEDTL